MDSVVEATEMKRMFREFFKEKIVGTKRQQKNSGSYLNDI